MSKMAQGIILVLFLLLGGSIFMVLTTYNQKQTLEQAKANLESQIQKSEKREKDLIIEKKNLETSLQEVQEAKTKLEEDLASANTQILDIQKKVDEITLDRDDWKGRLDAIKQERDDLMAKLAARPGDGSGAQVVKVEPIEEITNSGTTPGTGQAIAKTSLTPAPATDDPYWAQVVKERADLALQLDNYKKDLNAKILEVEELKKKNSELTLEMSSFTEERLEIEQKIKHGENLADSLSMELARVRNDRKFVGDKVERLQKENDGLRLDVKKLSETKLALEKSMARLSEDKTSVERKLVETEGLIQGRIDEIWEIKKSLDKSFEKSQQDGSLKREVELSPIVVSAPSSSVSTTVEDSPVGFKGKILSINSDNNFVIVDLGENSGVQIGESLGVFRGAQNIARLEIIQVRKDISAADIKEKAGSLQVGDIVR